jgi:hypothetical protein
MKKGVIVVLLLIILAGCTPQEVEPLLEEQPAFPEPQITAPVEETPPQQTPPAAEKLLSTHASNATAETITSAKGGIQVRTTPSGARIEVNNTFRGLSFQNIGGLSVGTYTIKLTKKGFIDKILEVSVKPRKYTLINLTLEEDPNLPSDIATSDKTPSLN